MFFRHLAAPFLMYRDRINNMKFLYKEKKLLSIYGPSAHIEIPSDFDTIGAYCFSQKEKVIPDAVFSKDLEALDHRIAGNDIETIAIPNTITKIEDYAFYNCRHLKSISLPAMCLIGSDIFTNCLNLHEVFIHCDSTQPSSLKQILAQIKNTVVVHFLDKSFLFSEYDENYDEIGPAHIFSLNLLGEGFRQRQCFHDNIFKVQEYDQTFDKLKSEASLSTLIFHSLYRLDDRKDLYKDFLTSNIETTIETIFKQDPINFSFLESLVKQDCLTSAQMDRCIQRSTKKNNHELTLQLMKLKKDHFFSVNEYDFGDL